MSDTLVRALTLAEQGRVEHRWIERNSGADYHQWIIDSRAADQTEADALTVAYRRGMIGEAAGGRMSIGVRGRAHLELNGGDGGPAAAERKPDGSDGRPVRDLVGRGLPASDDVQRRQAALGAAGLRD